MRIICDFMPAAAYNQIPFLEQQPPIPPSLLQDLGRLLVSHHLHDEWGIGIVHRHSNIPADHVMVHTREATDAEVCEPRCLQRTPLSNLCPISLLLNEDHHFQAYEYELGPQRALPSCEFFEELHDLLVSRHFGHVVSITAKKYQGFDMVRETLLLNDMGSVRGMLSTPSYSEPDGWTGTITGWEFRVGSEIEPVMVKACRMNPTGLHEVVKDA